MVKRAWSAALLALALLLLVCQPASADYLFTLERESVDVWIKPEGSLLLDYQLTFLNSPSGQPIDIVDVGLPKDEYDLSSFQAWVDGRQISDIRTSTAVDIGVEAHLAPYDIQPGSRGTVRVVGVVNDMVYRDDYKEELVSIEFVPTWYGSQYVQGTTDLTVRFHFPPAVTAEQTVYHRVQYSEAYFQGDHYVFVYHEPRALMTSDSYKYGVGAPAIYFTGIVEPPSLFMRMLSAIFTLLAGLLPLLCPLGFMAGIVILATWSSRRRRMQYLPPKVGIEGVGIKRGLTAPEAAILCETPLDRVLTMILFGLLRKGRIRVTKAEPVRLAEHNPDKRGLQIYEKRFFSALKPNGELDQDKLRSMLVELIRDVGEKMRGFSRKETVAYYQQIVAQAWKQVEQAGTPELKGQGLDNNAEWLIMDKDYEQKFPTVFHEGSYSYPGWWYYRPVPTWSHSPTSPGIPAGNFAHTIVRGVQNFGSSAVANIQAFTGKITGQTNPVPVNTRGGSRSGGGCACACACAGCACACAGGGR